MLSNDRTEGYMDKPLLLMYIQFCKEVFYVRYQKTNDYNNNLTL